MRRRLAALLLAVSCTGFAHAEDFPGIEQLMSAEEFEAAGLDKLSDAERDALDNWLLRYTARDAETLRSTSEDVREAEQEARIEARVRTPFRGWNGNTLFYLENGQVWQQRLEGRFAYEGGDREVILDKNFFGFWRLTHVATGRKVGVKRIR
ncbi:hypothetical protein [Pseudohaliea rubra]|uniref:Lipoprotein n=1 Tax=Pseudohaliea rubra DSM 19751 TaxID=1265313 RepID=A0A095VRR1_9GAMM|nr:hypothetical protein [Pseudohaliea rubra]KGE04107.1 hypothetical protein HRUBRA_01331 [Pseudohaliea rubra DSM 19751]